jgi:hypothetical protein
MLRLIAIFTGCSLALAVSVQAKEQTDQADAKKQSQKPKNVQKQQFIPKQQQQQRQLKTPSTHVQKLHTDANTNVSKNRIQKDKKQLQITNQQQLQTNTQQIQKNKLTKQTVEKIRSQHVDFHAKPNTSIASVKFNQNYQIAAAQNWNGPNYQVFRSYHPQWHDQGWWRSNYTTLSLIGGGWYYWDAGYWCPAWGYDEGAAYYPYDGPIYSGPRARPFDQVVADVQAALQEQGYYKGEVDGLLGPLTRHALAEYQSAQGLYATETIDQPTLDSLGLG